MSTFIGTTTLGTAGTGVVVAAPNFQGESVEIKVSGPVGGGNTTQFSLGWSDGVRQNCDTLFNDGSIRFSDKVTNKVLSVYENVGGTLTEVLSASFHSFTATQLKLNVLIANSNYKVSFNIVG